MTTKDYDDFNALAKTVVDQWWRNGGNVWAKNNPTLAMSHATIKNEPFVAFAQLIGDPYVASDARLYIVDIKKPRVQTLLSAAKRYPSAVFKMLELDYDPKGRDTK